MGEPQFNAPTHLIMELAHDDDEHYARQVHFVLIPKQEVEGSGEEAAKHGERGRPEEPSGR